MSEKPFYVYEHWRPDTGACFYVGKGTRRRAWNLRERNPHHTSIISKLTALGYSVDVRVIARDLTEQEAFDLERQRIALYSRKVLCNMTDGGDGSSGWVPSEEYRRAMSVRYKGRILSLKHRTVISIGRKGLKFSPAHIANMARVQKGKTLSAEHRAKMSAAHKGVKKARTAVEKQRQAIIGSKHTPEALAKMSAVRREWWRRKRAA